MNAKQYDLIVEAFSRRKFLRTGALAASALVGVQEWTSIFGGENSVDQDQGEGLKPCY